MPPKVEKPRKVKKPTKDDYSKLDGNEKTISGFKIIGYLLFGIFDAMVIVAFVLSIMNVIRNPKHGVNATNGVDAAAKSTFALSMYTANFVYDAGFNVVSFVTETIDTDGFHNSSFPTRMTVKEDTVGYYLIQVTVVFQEITSSDENTLIIKLMKNNATELTYSDSTYIGPNIETLTLNLNLVYLDYASAGDYYTVSLIIPVVIDATPAYIFFTATYQGAP